MNNTSPLGYSVPLEGIQSEQMPETRGSFAFFKDEEWMRLIVESFSIATRSFQLAGNVVGYVPYLSIASSPFYLYHAIKDAKQYLQLMSAAALVSRVADVFFWLGKGINSIGAALGDIIKPFAGGFQLTGLTAKHTVFQVAFNAVIPIVLIVCGTIGVIVKGWGMVRTGKALKEFKIKSLRQDGSVTSLMEMLAYIKGGETPSAEFVESHFTNKPRQEAILNRIQALGEHPNLHKVREALDLYQRVQNEEESELALLDEALALYENNLSRLEGNSEIYNEIKAKGDELLVLKREILQEGGEIIGAARSEVRRKLLGDALLFLIAVMAIAAGVIILQGHYARAGYILSITGSGLNIAYVIFEKSVSQESFYKINRSLEKKFAPRL